MSTFSDSYVSRVLFATSAPGRSLDVAAQRWHWLRTSLFDSYRPELHYMRGQAKTISTAPPHHMIGEQSVH